MRRVITVCSALLVSFTLAIIGCGEGDEAADIGDTTPPTVKDVVVAGDTSAAATNGPIVIAFSEGVNPGSVHSAVKFTPQVVGTVSYDEETSTLTFDPKFDLQAHTKYSVTVSNVVDRAGNMMDPFTFDILTGEKDVKPPTIVETTPADGEPEASTYPRINIEFSERVDQTRIARDLSLKPDVGVPVDRWVFTWSEDGKQVEIFIPLEEGLEPERKFSLHIGVSSVADLVGNQMERRFQIEFTTAERPFEDIDPESATALQQEWIYIIWKDQMDTWHIIWGGSAPAGAVKRGQGTIFSKDGDIDDVNPVAWEAGDQQSLSGDGVLTFSAAVDGTGGTDGLEFKVKGKTVTFRLQNAKTEWIFIGSDRKHPESTTFTLLNEDN
jgi:hypothetical protein